MTAFEGLAPHLPTLSTLPVGDTSLVPLPRAPIGSFGDDLMLPSGRRLAVRVVARGDTERLTLDFRDSDPADAEGFGLERDDVRLAAVLATCHALGTTADRRWLERLAVELDPRTWVGGRTAADPGRRAFGLARVFDAVLGALASSWPSRVGAGSCSVGAVVQLSCDEESLCEAIPGGEGATPARHGRSGWSSPVLGMVSTASFVDWLSITQSSRTGSGGGGARPGGDGVVRTYTVERDALVLVGIDRVRNPPHGVDRAGPPKPALVERIDADGNRSAIPTWSPFTLPAGSTLRIETAGGAGHGFGGYGDIEFDTSDWFGSKKNES